VRDQQKESGCILVAVQWFSSRRVPLARESVWRSLAPSVRVRRVGSINRLDTILLVILIAGLQGCSISREVPIRETSDGTYFDLRKAPISFPGSSIQLKDGSIHPAEDILLESDSVLWSASGMALSAPIDSLDQITGTNHYFGAAEGLGVGLIIGCIPGAIIGGIASSNSQDYGSAFLVGVTIGTALGGVIGTTYGAIVGHRYIISFVREN
jgi:hypothetical protein